MTLVHERYQMRTNQNGTKVYFLGFFLREASRMRTAVQSQNLKVKFYNFFLGSANQKSNRGVGGKPLDPEAVFPKEYEFGCGLWFINPCGRPGAWGSP